MTGSPGSSDNVLDAIIQGKLKGVSKDVFDKSDKYKKCKQMLCVSQFASLVLIIISFYCLIFMPDMMCV